MWTDKGMVSIEKIQVGDMVLSKSETTGEKTYKRVLRTFRTEDQELRTLCAEGAMNEDGSELLVEYLFATPGHPIWVNGRGWMPLADLEQCWEFHKIDDWSFERANGDQAEFFLEMSALGVPPISLLDATKSAFVTTDVHGVDGHLGYCMRFDGRSQVDHINADYNDGGYPMRFSRVPDYRVVKSPVRIVFQGATFTCDDWEGLDNLSTNMETLRTTVFSLEVEDFHTYYVGELGLWVHNVCDSFPRGLMPNPSVNPDAPR